MTKREAALKFLHEAQPPTLRDRFAMAALQGILASGQYKQPHEQSRDQLINGLTLDAWALADAMLAKREVKKP